MPSKNVKLAIGGTVLAAVAYYLYKSNADATAAATSLNQSAAAAAAQLAASNAASNVAAAKDVSSALATVGPQKAISPLTTPTTPTTVVGILGSLPNSMIHFWPDTDVLALVGPSHGGSAPRTAPKPGEGYVSALDLFYEVSMAGKNVIFQQVTGAVPSNVSGGPAPTAPVYTYFRLMEPNEPIPVGWNLFLGPNAADAAYRAASINIAAMQNVPVPASSQNAPPAVAVPAVPALPPQPVQPPMWFSGTTPQTTGQISVPAGFSVDASGNILDSSGSVIGSAGGAASSIAPPTPLASRQPAILSGLKGQYLTLINAAPGLASYSLTPNGPADYPALDLVYTANRSGSQIFFDLTGDPAVAGSQILYVADASMAAPTASSMLMFAPGDVVAAAAAAGIDPATIQVITMPSPMYAVGTGLGSGAAAPTTIAMPVAMRFAGV